jgi:hypothetical protein
MIEIWKDIEGYENLYQVSNMGRVRSLDRIVNNRHIKGVILKPRKNRCGYLYVNLYDTPKHYISKTVHRLVCEAFLPNPDNLPIVNHKNEKKDCNIVWVNEDGSIDYDKTNFEWCDAKYNSNYGTTKERSAKGRSNIILQFDLEGNFIKKWDGGVSEVGRVLGFNPSNVAANINHPNTRHTAHGFIWKNYDLDTYLIAKMNKTIKEKRMAC